MRICIPVGLLGAILGKKQPENKNVCARLRFLELSWGSLGGLGRFLGLSWGSLGAPLILGFASSDFLEAPRAVLGLLGAISCKEAAPGCESECQAAISWALLGLSWGSLGALGGYLDSLKDSLGNPLLWGFASWTLLGSLGLSWGFLRAVLGLS